MACGFITKTALHYTRNHGAVPNLTWGEHCVEVVGDDIESTSFSMDEISTDFQLRSFPMTMCCAGNRRKEQNMMAKTVGFSWNTSAHSTSVWTGPRLRDLLLKAGLKWDPEDVENDNMYVWMVGADALPQGNYGTCVPLGHVMNEANDVILAFKQNGSQLHPDRGFPVRVVIPG